MCPKVKFEIGFSIKPSIDWINMLKKASKNVNKCPKVSYSKYEFAFYRLVFTISRYSFRSIVNLILLCVIVCILKYTRAYTVLCLNI